MSQSDQFETQVRHALQIEAEAGPDYRDKLHAQVMERISRASLEQGNKQPTPPSFATTPIILAVFIIIAIIVAVALTR